MIRLLCSVCLLWWTTALAQKCTLPEIQLMSVNPGQPFDVDASVRVAQRLVEAAQRDATRARPGGGREIEREKPARVYAQCVRLVFVLALLLVACSTRPINPSDAGDANRCPAQEPVNNAGTCFFAPSCDAPNTICHYGDDTCNCVASPGYNYWYCDQAACRTASSGTNGECSVLGATCCDLTEYCTCTRVCTSVIWQCFGEGGNDMSTAPGVDMCP